VEATVEKAVAAVVDASVTEQHAAAAEHDSMAAEHTVAADRSNALIQDRADRRKFMLKMVNRIGVWIVLLFAAFGAAVFIQSVLATLDEKATHRNEFVSECATGGNRVFVGDNNQWVCVKGDVMSVTNTSGEPGTPSKADAQAACVTLGFLPLSPFNAETWVYCVKGVVVDVLQ
jgi:hypothetical protein